MNNFEDFVDYAISLNERLRNSDKILKEHMSPLHYAHEFCTIHLNIGRQSGKTKYIIDNATETDLVIVQNHYHAIDLKQNGCKAKVVGSTNFNYELSERNRGLKNLTAINRVFIDEPKLCFENVTKENIFETVLFYNSFRATIKLIPIFILLGT